MQAWWIISLIWIPDCRSQEDHDRRLSKETAEVKRWNKTWLKYNNTNYTRGASLIMRMIANCYDICMFLICFSQFYCINCETVRTKTVWSNSNSEVYQRAHWGTLWYQSWVIHFFYSSVMSSSLRQSALSLTFDSHCHGVWSAWS